MARRVFKYPLSLNAVLSNEGKETVQMPLGAQIRHVGVQFDRPTLWVEVDPESPPQDHTFRILATGHSEVPARSEYVGTVQMLGADGNEYVWHIYEEIS